MDGEVKRKILGMMGKMEVHVREADHVEKGALEVIPEAQGFAEARKLLYLQVFERHMGFGEWQR